MSKSCISSCVSDTRNPIRVNYASLHKWPESDAEFVRSAAGRGGARPRSRVVDGISCRQMYLRSYTFTREEEGTIPEKAVKCFARVRERAAAAAAAAGRRTEEEVGLRRRRRRRKKRREGLRLPEVVVGKVKRLSCGAACTVFRRLLFCAASVDVVV
ncbi:serine/threonine-protein kinase TAO3 [Striga asiatica]|uniref:Serine/threonine-protein kinase TAO3 n=1 Tax=Striga asiatica TaxID=4170 RepID=A0A5A7RJG1_STRAF|nr:serine/threonine-protein kinase TAO3 [Striga asiatica]